MEKDRYEDIFWAVYDAGYLAMEKHKVNLFDIDQAKVAELKEQGGIYLRGKIKGFGALNIVTNNLEEAIRGAELLMIVTTANAHSSLAEWLAPLLEEGQVILLNPGRTCGALEFRQVLFFCQKQKDKFQ